MTPPSANSQRSGRARKLGWGLVAATVLVLLILDRLGEWSAVLALALFAPAWIWIVPALIAVPLYARRHRRIAAALLAVCAWHFVVHMDLQVNPFRGAPGSAELTLLTINRGEDGAVTFLPFAREHSPDFILLQEANGFGPHYSRQFPGYEASWTDEFVLLSKHPIRSSELLYLQTLARRVPMAARFVVEVRGEPIAVYNVHLLTPREALQAVLQPRARRDFFPITTREYGREYWRNRLDVARELMDAFDREPLPLLAGGDFNMPSWGRMQRIFSGRLQDAHRVAGRGFGRTFPGSKPAPLGLFGTWLRLDYIFAGPEWRVVRSAVEPPRDAQHLAVLATVERR